MTSTPIERAQKRLGLIAKRKQQISQLKRLRADVRRQKEKLQKERADLEELAHATSGSLKTAREEFEAEMIKQALASTNGKITKAAHIIGVSYQALAYIIETRHSALLTMRSPVYRRKGRSR
jgi:transcriptional regulator with PAS, ATPase and Fis domain